MGFLGTAACVLLLASAADEDWAKRLADLEKVYGEEEREFYRPWREAKTPEERQKLGPPDVSKGPVGKRLDEFVAIARGAKGTEPGVRAAVWVLGRGSAIPAGAGLAAEAFDLLVKDGADCPALTEAIPLVRYQHPRLGAEKVEGALLALGEKSASNEVRAAALVERAAWRLEDPASTEAKRAEAREILGVVLAKHAGTRSAARARGLRNEAEGLLDVGKAA